MSRDEENPRSSNLLYKQHEAEMHESSGDGGTAAFRPGGDLRGSLTQVTFLAQGRVRPRGLAGRLGPVSGKDGVDEGRVGRCDVNVNVKHPDKWGKYSNVKWVKDLNVNGGGRAAGMAADLRSEPNRNLGLVHFGPDGTVPQPGGGVVENQFRDHPALSDKLVACTPGILNPKSRTPNPQPQTPNQNTKKEKKKKKKKKKKDKNPPLGGVQGRGATRRTRCSGQRRGRGG